MQRGLHGSGRWAGVAPPKFSFYTHSMPYSLGELLAELAVELLPESKTKRGALWMAVAVFGLFAIWYQWARWWLAAWAIALLIYEFRQWRRARTSMDSVVEANDRHRTGAGS